MFKPSLFCAASLVLSTALAGSASAQGTVKVGMVMPLTGPLAAAGQQVLAGARLYVKQHGDTVAGKKIELIVKDDASSGETGKRLIQELIVNDKVDIIGGGPTADLIASAGAHYGGTEADRNHDFEHDSGDREIALLCPHQLHARAIVCDLGGLDHKERASPRL